MVRSGAGLVLPIPVLGPVVIPGYLAATAFPAIAGAVVTGGQSAALYGTGIPKDSVIRHETAFQADGFAVMAYGRVDDMVRAKAILSRSNP